MHRYIIQTLITCERNFKDKKEFKNWMVENYVPEGSDELRNYNFKIMDLHGHENFFLTFLPPNKGILTHIYKTEKEYQDSIPLRANQKIMFESNDMSYEISDVFMQILK